MQVSVVLERMKGNGYRARGLEPFAVIAEGSTREEALRKLRERIEERLVEGVEVVQLEIPATENPWLRLDGVYKDDPLFDEWQEAIAEYRRQVDAGPSSE